MDFLKMIDLPTKKNKVQFTEIMDYLGVWNSTTLSEKDFGICKELRREYFGEIKCVYRYFIAQDMDDGHTYVLRCLK